MSFQGNDQVTLSTTNLDFLDQSEILEQKHAQLRQSKLQKLREMRKSKVTSSLNFLDSQMDFHDDTLNINQLQETEPQRFLPSNEKAVDIPTKPRDDSPQIEMEQLERDDVPAPQTKIVFNPNIQQEQQSNQQSQYKPEVMYKPEPQLIDFRASKQQIQQETQLNDTVKLISNTETSDNQPKLSTTVFNQSDVVLQYKQIIQQKNAQLFALEEHVQNLQNENQSLRQQTVSVQLQQNLLVTDQQRHKQQIESLNAQLDELNNQLIMRNNELQDAYDQIEQAKNSGSSKQYQLIAALKDQIEGLRQENGDYLTQTSEQEQEIVSLRKQVETLQITQMQKNDVFQNTIQSIQLQLQQAQQQLAKSQKQNEYLQTENQNLFQNNLELANKAQLSEQLLQQVQQQKETLLANMQNEQSEVIAQLERKIQDITSITGSQKQEIQKLRIQCQAEQEEKANAFSKVQQIQTECKLKDNTNAQLQQKIDDLEKLDPIQMKVNFDTELSKLSQQIELTEFQNDEISKENKKLKTQVQQLLVQKQSLDEFLETQKQLIQKSAETQVQQLQQQITRQNQLLQQKEQLLQMRSVQKSGVVLQDTSKDELNEQIDQCRALQREMDRKTAQLKQMQERLIKQQTEFESQKQQLIKQIEDLQLKNQQSNVQLQQLKYSLEQKEQEIQQLDEKSKQFQNSCSKLESQSSNQGDVINQLQDQLRLSKTAEQISNQQLKQLQSDFELKLQYISQLDLQIQQLLFEKDDTQSQQAQFTQQQQIHLDEINALTSQMTSLQRVLDQKIDVIAANEQKIQTFNSLENQLKNATKELNGLKQQLKNAKENEQKQDESNTQLTQRYNAASKDYNLIKMQLNEMENEKQALFSDNKLLTEQIDNINQQLNQLKQNEAKQSQTMKQIQTENAQIQQKAQMTNMEFKRYKEQAQQQIEQLMKIKGVK
ncbi:Hypothetical_protein [Hexamita inflata]|uniref:Hypothetical_protein n=1 Tax=Hexamita inflata TaxID=28002 RepID=A0AA86RE27_9EUKA|nr:Hypothetical protein HINF_LOCUS60011 [Hexamita inflata]